MIPSALVEGGERAHGLWREDVRRGSGCRAVEKENRSHLVPVRRDNLWQSHPPPRNTHTPLLMGADIALWIGWDQRACDKQMFLWIGILGQVGLVNERERRLAARTKECLPFCTW